MNKPWISPDTGTDPTIFDVQPVIIRHRIAQEVKGVLHLESVNDKGQILIFVTYNSSPFSDMVRNEVFYLTQEQLAEYQNKGPNCILIPQIRTPPYPPP